MQGQRARYADALLLPTGELRGISAGVGVVQKLDLIVNHGVAFLGVLVISVLITLLVTVATFLLASRLLRRKEDRP